MSTTVPVRRGAQPWPAADCSVCAPGAAAVVSRQPLECGELAAGPAAPGFRRRGGVDGPPPPPGARRGTGQRTGGWLRRVTNTALRQIADQHPCPLNIHSILQVKTSPRRVVPMGKVEYCRQYPCGHNLQNSTRNAAGLTCLLPIRNLAGTALSNDHRSWVLSWRPGARAVLHSHTAY